MARRSAIGIFNGNWKNKWKRDLELENDRRRFIVENNIQKFQDALKVLKSADRQWETWFDNDDNIPQELTWTDTKEIDELCLRMVERAKLVKEQRR